MDMPYFIDLILPNPKYNIRAIQRLPIGFSIV
jgi:hypothetical protein